MPINTDLNAAPYFDDFDIENQYHRVLFKPGYAVQARELTQLQTMLQSQIEQFGDNIFKEGSIVKGCNFTELDDLQFVRLQDIWTPYVSGVPQDPTAFDPRPYIPQRITETVLGVETEFDLIYQLTGETTNLRANVIASDQGVEVRTPNLNTFYISYLNSNEANNFRVFQPGEVLTLTQLKFKAGTQNPEAADVEVVLGKVSSTNVVATTGKSFGIQSAPGIIFQKGHFLFADAQTLVVSKYNNLPDEVNVGYLVKEDAVAAINDDSLYDNANGSKNENAPGADRLRLVPSLTVFTSVSAENNADFFSLVRYQNGNAITLRDVSQYNVLGDELARRTYEESGNYVLERFPLSTDDRLPAGAANTEVHAILGPGIAYVKGYRVENSADRSFVIDQIAETETVSNQSVSFQYGGGIPIETATDGSWLSSGTTDIDWQSILVREQTGTAIGDAVVYNITPTDVYMTGVQLSGGARAGDIHEIFDNNGVITFDGDFSSSTSPGATQKQSSSEVLIFPTGHRSLFSTEKMAIPVRVRENITGISGNQITINADPGEDFNCNNDEILVVASGPSMVRVASYSTGPNNSSLIINCEPADNVGTQATVYFNKRLVGGTVDGVSPYDKLVKTPFVKANYSPGDAKYNLGFPDVFDIISITDANGDDFTNSFRLQSNQKDTYYDHSYIEYIPGRPQPASGVMSIQLKVFEISSGSGEYFFTINSYPNTLDRFDIPVYRAKNGSAYNLRECLDFRPYVDKASNVGYDDDLGAAQIPNVAVGANSKTFTALTPITPARNASASMEVTYYLQRVDTIVCDSYGGIKVVKGREEKLAVPPAVETDQMALGNVFVPGYPALSEREASRTGRKAYGVHTQSTGIKAFTMKDMHSLGKQIDRLSYYVSLSQLEASTQNMFVPDENGLDRFKNGFIVDPFNDLSVADVSDPAFKAAVPFNQKILTPAVKTFPIDLIYKSSSSAAVFPTLTNAKAATLGRDSSVEILSQTYATGFRNCVSNAYSYQGIGEISPPYDAAYDTTVNPAEINIDMTSAFTDFVENLQEFIPLTDVTTERVVGGFEQWNDIDGWAPPRQFGRGGRQDFQFRGGNTFTQRIETTTRSIELNQAAQVQNIEVGEFVRNFNFEPYMAGRDIRVYMSGLRPSARHWFFFDGVDVNEYVFPGTEADRADSVQRSRTAGYEVTTDENGVLRAVFALPSETFFVGDRVLEIVDVDTYDQIESAAISKGFVTYRAYNFSVEKTSVGVSTRAPTFDINTSSSFRNVVRRIPAGDPLAQTFFIKKGMGKDSNSVYISNIDLYFKRKSTENGVTVELREVVNGYPSGQVLPFGKVHKLPAEVNVSDDSSVATTFTFDAPVRMDVEKEYAVSIKPDAQDPNYLAFISQVGGTDLTPGDTQGSAIVQDWGDGVLFSSTNNRAWRSYQDEDLKFVLRRHNFNESTGSVTFTNNKHEFFTLSGGNGLFQTGEIIYQTKALGAGTGTNVSVLGSDATRITLSGSNLDSTYLDGDYIILEDGSSNKDIFRILSVPNATTMTVDKPINMGPGPSVSNGPFSHSPIVIGTISFWDRNDPNKMHLEASSASSSRFFASGADINGLDSGFSATISSVDNINLSYFQPMIMKASDSTSKTNMFGTFNPYDDGGTTYDMPLRFNDNNHFNVAGTILSSRSNVVTNPNSTAEFSLTVTMDNGANVTSTPFVDLEVSKLIAYQYQVQDTSAPGYSPLANPTSTYVSKQIELAPELDAEDIYVATTEYRPPGSTVKVYMRAQNQYDSQAFKEVPWIELENFEGSDISSSISDINDYREFGYRLPESAKDAAGRYSYTSNTGNRLYQGYRRFAIKIEMISPNVHTAPTLRDYRAIAIT